MSNPAITGEAAHIAGEKLGAARYDTLMTDDQRNHYRNLIYLCGDCHTRIDKQDTDFPVRRLLDMKVAHELTVREAMMEAFSDIGFPELEEATQWIFRVEPGKSSYDYSLIPPDDKIRKNDLGSSSRHIITLYLSVAREVRLFIESVSQTSYDFPERLKAGFLEEYFRLRKERVKGDDLFDLMCRFAQRGFKNQAKRSACLAVLVYLFEACEVFEK